jgi:hypothetical protein
MYINISLIRTALFLRVILFTKTGDFPFFFFFFRHICVVGPSKLTHVARLQTSLLIFQNYDLKIFTYDCVLQLGLCTTSGCSFTLLVRISEVSLQLDERAECIEFRCALLRIYGASRGQSAASLLLERSR